MQKESPAPYAFDVAPTVFAPDFPVVFLPNSPIDDKKITSVHIHDSLELGLCHEGAGIFIIGNKVLPYKAGDAVIINDHEAHRAQSRRGVASVWSWVYIDVPHLLANFAMDYALLDCSTFCGDSFVNVISPDRHANLCGSVERIVEELRREGLQYERVTRALVLYLLTLLHRSFGEPRTSPHDADRTPHLHRVHKALTQISSRYAEKVHIRGLAEACNLSIPHFRRVFHRATGRNPLEYLLHLRLTMACLELKSTDKSAERVAADTGFPTFSCFLRKFKSAYGTTPHKWRQG